MRIACIADQHGGLPDIPDADVLIIAGDISPFDFHDKPESMVIWWMGKFRRWLQGIHSRGIKIVAIAGNHDFILQTDRPMIERFALPWTYLEDEGIEIDGVKFWGSPWQPYFGGWAFNAPPREIIGGGEVFLLKKFSLIPEDTDVLVTHGPPAGILDRVGLQNVGSLALNEQVEIVQPKLHVFGHIHVGFGVETIDKTTFANVALCDNTLKIRNPVTVIDID